MKATMMKVKRMKVMNFKCCAAFALVLSTVFLLGASIWEGAAAVSTGKDLPDTGIYVATNSFPRNTVVDITNLETGKTVRAMVAAGLDQPGLLAVVSKEGADALGLSSRSIGRVRMEAPADAVAFGHFAEDALRSGDPDYDPEAALSTWGAETEPAAPAAASTAPAVPPVSPPPAAASSAAPSVAVVPAEPAAEEPVYEDEPPEADWTYLGEWDEPAEPEAPAIAEVPSEPEPEPFVEEHFAETPIGEEPLAEEHFPEEEPIAEEPLAEEPAAEEPIAETPVYKPEYVLVPTPSGTYATPAPEPAAEPAPAPAAETVPEYALVPAEERVPEYEDEWEEMPYIPPVVAPPPPPPVAAAPPPRAPASAFSVPTITELESGKYYVQLRAYSKREAVESELARIGSDYPLAVQSATVGGKEVYRVLVGPLGRDESGRAYSLREVFRKSGYGDAFIRTGN